MRAWEQQSKLTTETETKKKIHKYYTLRKFDSLEVYIFVFFLQS